jgi:8-oxo-dGTP pyrophosphatase MutT (NUDIX family)
MEKCDHKSVGVIVENDANEILLLSRARFPFGWSAPAGHEDGHGSPEQTGIDEVFEETGVVVDPESMTLIINGLRVQNRCRRPGGEYHDWTLYRARALNQEIIVNPEESLDVQWMTRRELAHLATLPSSEKNQQGDIALEPLWKSFFATARILTE